MKKLFLLLVAFLFVCTPVFAQGPAVSQLNGKVDVTAGSVDGEDTVVGSASIALPLGEMLGLQLDGAFGELDSEDLQGGAAHLFMRDPELYLLGVTAVFAEVNDVEIERYGVEAEGYFGRFTVAAAAGQQSGDIDDAAYGSLDLRYYPMDKLMVEVGGSATDDDFSLAHIGAEYQADCGFAMFVDLATGEDDYDHALAGVRYYFGAKGKSLIDRHRQDDPVNNVLGTVIGGYGSVLTAAQSVAAETDGGSVGGNQGEL